MNVLTTSGLRERHLVRCNVCWAFICDEKVGNYLDDQDLEFTSEKLVASGAV